MEEIDFSSDTFSDIVAKDNRYHSRAYALLTNAVSNLTGTGGKHVSGADVLDEFKELTLDQFGPLSFRVLSDWGVHSCEDVGEMMYNLVAAGRIQRDESDSKEDFLGGYDFGEAFLQPFEV